MSPAVVASEAKLLDRLKVKVQFARCVDLFTRWICLTDIGRPLPAPYALNCSSQSPAKSIQCSAPRPSPSNLKAIDLLSPEGEQPDGEVILDATPPEELERQCQAGIGRKLQQQDNQTLEGLRREVERERPADVAQLDSEPETESETGRDESDEGKTPEPEAHSVEKDEERPAEESLTTTMHLFRRCSALSLRRRSLHLPRRSKDAGLSLQDTRCLAFETIKRPLASDQLAPDALLQLSTFAHWCVRFARA